MPGLVPPVADERAALLGYLRQMRLVIKIAAYGLTDEQARATPSASTLSVGGLVEHVAAVEQSWMDTVLERPQGTETDYEANFRLEPGETLAEVLEHYDAVAAETEAVVASIPDLGQAVPVPQGVPWFPDDGRGMVGALGSPAPHHGDLAPCRARRHRPRVDRRCDRFPADGRGRALARNTVAPTVGAKGQVAATARSARSAGRPLRRGRPGSPSSTRAGRRRRRSWRDRRGSTSGGRAARGARCRPIPDREG
jgi:hypothetical protein